ncbi:MAG: hypothetical protein DME80_14300 [Verrucomicrobia bacterium]|nr:MAG: hypothetical protein DME80_14300 [Verrucomicrobiota bacterium]
MMAPMPIHVRSNALSVRFICRSAEAASAIRCSGLLVLKSCEPTGRDRVIKQFDWSIQSFARMRVELARVYAHRRRENVFVSSQPYGR